MQVDYVGDVYVARCTFEERLIVRKAGFQWDPVERRWATSNPLVAAGLGLDNMTTRARTTLGVGNSIPVPPGLEYLPFQEEGIAFGRDRPKALIADQPGLGKGHPLSTCVLTPKGWATIGDLEVGDRVIGWHGGPIPVKGVYDRGVLPVYRVTFDDGATVLCDSGHLWCIYAEGDYDSQEVIDTLALSALVHGGDTVAIPTLASPAQLRSKCFSVDPLIAGTDIASVHGATRLKSRAYSDDLGYTIREYQLCAPHQAVDFLRGIIATIGRVRGDDNHIRLDFINNQAAPDIRDVIVACVRQLGGLAYVERRYRQLRFRIYLPHGTFKSVIGGRLRFKHLNANLRKYEPGVPQRIVTGVEPVGSALVRCIAVDGPGNLYVTEDFILTHNTIQALGVINSLPQIENVLIIPPATLKRNWYKEAAKWLVNKELSIEVANGPNFPSSNIVIVNYDVLHKHRDAIRAGTWDLTICDEHHYAKNKDAKRTKEIHGGVEKRKVKLKTVKNRIEPLATHRLLMLSGTPLASRTGDLWTSVAAADPYDLGRDYYDFHKRYCGGYYDSYGEFNPNGDPKPEMLAELNRKMKARFMIRRLKADVLSQLPEKIRQIVPLPQDGLKSLIEKEKQAMTDLLDCYEKMIGIRKEMGEEDLAKAILSIKPATWEAYAKTVDGDAERIEMPLTRLANARKDLAIAKLPMVIEYVQNLRETGEKVVIFAYHTDVIEGLAKAFPNASVIYGKTPMESKRHPERTRQAQVDRFQEDPNVGEMIGQYTAAGTGWTMTAACHFVSAELVFVPHELLQAEDRCIVKGQKIFTSEGMIPIEDIKCGDLVLTHTGAFKPVIDKWSGDRRKLRTTISCMGYSEELNVTSDHEILRETINGVSWCKAMDVRPRDWLLLPVFKLPDEPLKEILVDYSTRISDIFINNLGKTQRNGRAVHLPKTFQVTNQFLEFCGRYIAEGFSAVGSDKGRFISIAAHENERPILESYIEMLNSLYGIKATIRQAKNSKGIELRGYSGELARTFYDWFGHGSHNKRLPHWVWQLNSYQAEILLNGYKGGDGHETDTTHEWTTVSERLAHETVMLHAALGYAPTLRQVKNNSHNNGHWIGSISTTGGADSRLSPDYVRFKVKSVLTEIPQKVAGKSIPVYDITVSEDNSFVAGLHVVHNCHRIGSEIHDAVWAHHLCVEGSLDDTMILRLLKRMRIIEMALD